MRPDPLALPVVLAVEDDPGVRDALGLVLEDDCAVVFAPDGPEAVEVLASRPVDVVLLDLMLPRMPGCEVLTHIRKTHVRTPVIVVSALNDAESIVTAVKFGAWDYVTKPWHNDELLSRILGAVRQRRNDPGVLLVSDDVGALAPLQLALEPRTRVLATGVAHAPASNFPAQVVVLHSRNGHTAGDARMLHRYFPDAVFVVVDNATASEPGGRFSGLPVTAIVESGRLDGLMSELVRLGVSQATMPFHGRLAAAIGFIAAHYGDPITVRDIAQAAHLSEDRLAHVFREGTGTSVMEYLTRLRITIARRLLVERTDTVEAISTRVGFADVSNFSRNFKQLVRVPPAAFRRQSMLK